MTYHFDSHTLMYHVHEVSAWLKGEIPAPIYVEIGPTQACNHRCSFCALDYLPSQGARLSKEVLSQTLKSMAAFGVKSIMFGGEGEPLIHPHLPYHIQEAKAAGLDVALTTNGVFLSQDVIERILPLMSWIKISIDAGTKETYAAIHGTNPADFDTLFNNLEAIGSYRKANHTSCTVGCQMLLLENNIQEVTQLIQKVHACGVDYLVLKPYSQHPYSQNRLSFDISSFDESLKKIALQYSTESFQVIYRSQTFLEIEKKISYRACLGVAFFALIDARGNVLPCNLYYDKPEWYYGNINEASFETIWKSERRKQVVERLHQMHLKQTDGLECRKGCRLHYVNQYLDCLLHNKPKHVNFI